MGETHTRDAPRPIWRELGDGAQAHPTLLVHGWMVSSRVWAQLAPNVPGRRLIAPDLCGAGEAASHIAALSTSVLAARLSLTQLADDVLAVADAAGLEHFDLVGHSMGGAIAQLVAARAPSRVRTLALLCPVPLSGLSLPADADALFHSAGGDAEKLGTILDLACKALAKDARTALVEDALRIAPPVIATGVDVFTRGADAALDAVRAPTLVLATDDPFLPPDFLDEHVARRIHGARLEVLRGPGHYPQVEAPRETAEVLERFWGRQP